MLIFQTIANLAKIYNKETLTFSNISPDIFKVLKASINSDNLKIQQNLENISNDFDIPLLLENELYNANRKLSYYDNV